MPGTINWKLARQLESFSLAGPDHIFHTIHPSTGGAAHRAECPFVKNQPFKLLIIHRGWTMTVSCQGKAVTCIRVGRPGAVALNSA